jgi:hypothetical protein
MLKCTFLKGGKLEYIIRLPLPKPEEYLLQKDVDHPQHEHGIFEV